MPLTLATFNVKDLFDAHDDASRAHLARKLEWTAAMIARVDADVLALQEVGSAAVLDALLDRVPGRGGYVATIVGTADKRGIRCALATRRPLLGSHVHTAATLPFPAFVAGDADPFAGRIPLRRGVVHARVDGGDLGAIDAFVAHFKSRRAVALHTPGGDEVAPHTARERAEGRLRSLVQRAAEALYVRGLVDAVLAREPEARVVVMGDLNDVPDSVTLDVLRGDASDPQGLDACARLVAPEQRWSVLHEGTRAQIDHVLVTRSLVPRLERARFLNESLREHAPHDGGASETIDSDHAPLVVRLS